MQQLQKVAEAATPVLDKLQDMATGVFKAAETAFQHAAPYVMKVTSMTCLVDVVENLLLFVVSFIPLSFTLRFLRNTIKEEYRDDGKMTAAVLFILIAVGFTVIMFLCCITDLWRWVGIWHPDLYLVHQAIVGITQNASNG